MQSPARSLLITAAFLLACPAATLAQEKLAGWHDSLERARAVARDSHKPLFVVFRCVR